MQFAQRAENNPNVQFRVFLASPKMTPDLQLRSAEIPAAGAVPPLAVRAAQGKTSFYHSPGLETPFESVAFTIAPMVDGKSSSE